MTHDFVHLHVHTEYSLLDGAIRTKDLAKKVSGWDNKAVAITDHGVMYGAIEFYENCKAQGVKPILGCEAYVDPENISSRTSKRFNHLILLAENNTGWHNLLKIISIANTNGYWYKPRIDHSILEQYHEGIIASSACLAGEIPQKILAGDIDGAISLAEHYRDVMGNDNFFLEIMPNTLPEQITVNKTLIEISRKTGIPLIATCDAHYPERNDYDWHKILLKINTHAGPDDDAFGFDRNEFYLYSPEEMYSKFGTEAPDALTNTVAIAERCNVDIPLSTGKYLLPHINLPDGMNTDDTLREKAREGLQLRFNGGEKDVPEQYAKRLEYELGVITQMGFSDYFLIVSGIIQAAKSRNIPIGPGRGSAAGSLVAWSLSITELDPLRHGLLFERFLNPERVSMPDIDTDVSDKGREELLKYISDFYGADHVAQIITFGRMKARQSVKDVGRAIGLEYSLVDKVAKLIPPTSKSLSQALDDTPDLKAEYENDLTAHNIIDKAKNIEGLARHVSQHAAGVVISPSPITDIVPVKRLGTGETSQAVTQCPMEAVEHIGLVKMDFLGLSNLSIIEEALQNIRSNGKTEPDMKKVCYDLNDAKALKLLQEADTMGVFQLETDGFRAMLRKLKIDCFDDLVAALAMYRPGPLDSGMVDQYIDCKHGRSTPKYPHPLLEPILRETYGVILYQEQVMQCASALAGYTLGEADLLRRAMGKKKPEVMAEHRSKFVDGAKERGINPDTASSIFDNIEKFAGYGFNKSHSAAYALISFQTAYLKANYPTEYMAALLSAHINDKKEAIAQYVKNVRRSGIDVLPPDINSSAEHFTPVGSVIRFGLGAVSRVGHNAVELIVSERNSHGKFVSLWDFVKRVDVSVVNKSALENLVKAGAFDQISPNRAMMINAIPIYLKALQKTAEKSSQLALFDELLAAEDEAITAEPEIPSIPDFDEHTKLASEKDATGLYISGHPFEAHEAVLSPYTNCTISELSFWRGQNAKACIAGIVASLTTKTTKKGDAMCILTLEDTEASVDAVIFPKMWEGLKDKIRVGEACIVEGKTDERNQFLPDNIIFADALKGGGFVTVALEGEIPNMKELARALNSCRGKSRVMLEFDYEGGKYRVLLGSGVDAGGISSALTKVLPSGKFAIK